MGNKNYFSVSTKGGILDFKQYAKIVQEEQKKIHQEWGQRMADGFNKIVKDWAPKARPYFQSIPRYVKATNNIFVYIYIRGTPKQKLIFDIIDHGAPRGQWVTAGAGISVAEDNIAPKAPQKPPPKVFYKFGAGGIPIPNPAADESRRIHAEYEAEIARINSIVSGIERAGPGRTKPMSRLGPTPYTPRTHKSGSYGGPGYSASANPKKSHQGGGRSKGDSAWRGRGQPKRMKLKPISARRFSLRLRFLIKGRAWPHAVDIWGSKASMMQENIVANGYARARRRISK